MIFVLFTVRIGENSLSLSLEAEWVLMLELYINLDMRFSPFVSEVNEILGAHTC
jgi:hypothetical protein